MAKYSIKYSCGHSQNVELFGKTSDREKKIDWYGKFGVCSECYNKKKQELRNDELEKSKQMAQTENLPNLEGSEKQINWATTIRANAIKANPDPKKALFESFSKTFKDKYQELFNIGMLAINKLKTETSAKWWIDNRDIVDYYVKKQTDGYLREKGDNYIKQYLQDIEDEKLKHLNIPKEILTGGEADYVSVLDLAKKYNVTTDEIEIALDKGRLVEMEHTDNPVMAYEISKDHISERLDYYDRLELIENNTDIAQKDNNTQQFQWGDQAKWGIETVKVEGYKKDSDQYHIRTSTGRRIYAPTSSLEPINKIENTMIKLDTKYQLGDMYSPDFDEQGMLRMVMSLNKNWKPEDIELLKNSLEDMNFHSLYRVVSEWQSDINNESKLAAVIEAAQNDLNETDFAENADDVENDDILRIRANNERKTQIPMEVHIQNMNDMINEINAQTTKEAVSEKYKEIADRQEYIDLPANIQNEIAEKADETELEIEAGLINPIAELEAEIIALHSIADKMGTPQSWRNVMGKVSELTDYIKDDQENVLKMFFKYNSMLSNKYKVNFASTDYVKPFVPKVNIWGLLPNVVIAKHEKQVLFTASPDDAKLLKIVEPFISTDIQMRKIMTSVHFDDKGIVATDANKIIFINKVSEQKGNYCMTKKCFTATNGEKENTEVFPQYSQVIPFAFDYKITLDVLAFKTFLINAINNKLGAYDFTPLMLKYSDDFIIQLRGDFMLSAIEAMEMLGHKSMELLFTTTDRAVMFIPTGNNDKIASFSTDFVLVMPMMMKDNQNYIYYDLTDSKVYTIGVDNGIDSNPDKIKFNEKLAEVDLIKTELQAEKSRIEDEKKQKAEQARIAAEDLEQERIEAENLTSEIEEYEALIEMIKDEIKSTKKKAEKEEYQALIEMIQDEINNLK